MSVCDWEAIRELTKNGSAGSSVFGVRLVLRIAPSEFLGLSPEIHD